MLALRPRASLHHACCLFRFATFLKDNYPRMHLTVSDLSPFYLAEARKNLKVGRVGWRCPSQNRRQHSACGPTHGSL